MVKKYSAGIGIGKSFKNVLIVWGVPALLLLLNNWVEWVPSDYQKILAPIIGMIAYFVKNYIQNK